MHRILSVLKAFFTNSFYETMCALNGRYKPCRTENIGRFIIKTSRNLISQFFRRVGLFGDSKIITTHFINGHAWPLG